MIIFFMVIASTWASVWAFMWAFARDISVVFVKKDQNPIKQIFLKKTDHLRKDFSEKSKADMISATTVTLIFPLINFL